MISNRFADIRKKSRVPCSSPCSFLACSLGVVELVVEVVVRAVVVYERGSPFEDTSSPHKSVLSSPTVQVVEPSLSDTGVRHAP